MSIKTRLWVVVLTILLLPPVTMGLLMYYQKLSGGNPSEALILSVRTTTEKLEGAVERGDFSAFSRLPPEVDLLVRLDDGRVLYRTPRGSDAPAKEPGARDFHRFRFKSSRGTGSVFLSVPGYLINQTGRPLWSLTLTLVLLLIIIIGLPLVMLRQLDRAIKKLEQAMVKIASGDLDFPSAEFMSKDLQSLGMALDRMRLQLKEERGRRDRFIMGISHDLKTPLAVIKGYVEALTEGLADTEEKRDSYQQILLNHTNLLEARVEHLIELAKTTSFEWRHHLTEQDLHAFICETLQSLSEYASFRGFSVQNENSLPSPCLVRFDRDMLRRVFENLISNAVSYGEIRYPILVTARSDPFRELLEITVENHGTPIPPEQVPLVFEPYFRGDTRKNKSGFGLGLASVKSIVESHGWTIDLRSTAEGKISFTIRIPQERGQI
jgi:signal transduction histidine kinase